MKNSGIKAVHGFVSGRVQGVGFRYSCVQKAQSLHLTGWVRNTFDGRVEVFVQGKSDSLDTMIIWLSKGPPVSFVSSFDYKPVTVKQEVKTSRVTY